MSKLFTTVQRAKVPYNHFPLGGERKLSFNMGELIPIYCAEVFPGDMFKASSELLIKFAPLKSPVMHRIRAYVDYFYVPYYQLTSVFDKFINPRTNTPDNPVLLPKIRPYDLASELTELDEGCLSDYLDLPVQQTGWKYSEKSKPISVLPFRAYQHIYNSFYRDQTLQPLEVDPGSTDLYLNTDFDKDFQGTYDLADLTDEQYIQMNNLFTLRYSAWKKDYFTSALPTPQAGPEVEIPFVPGEIVANGTFRFRDPDGNLTEESVYPLKGSATDEEMLDTVYISDENYPLEYGEGLSMQASSQPGLTINNMRMLFALQQFKELQARGGSRSPEVVRNYFGVKVPDLFVDRPAYLGGMYQDVSVGEVLQTSQTTTGASGSAQGYRAGVASVYGKTKTVRYHVKLWGFVIGLLRVLPEAVYYQGVERMWHRDNLFDYFFPQFAHLGEQEIYNRELYVDGTDADDEIFGFAPRYAEYKHGCSHVNGEFRSSLSYWHFGRKFASRPHLNAAFIKANQISTEPFNVTGDSADKLYCHMYTKVGVMRELPYYGTPGLSKL